MDIECIVEYHKNNKLINIKLMLGRGRFRQFLNRKFNPIVFVQKAGCRIDRFMNNIGYLQRMKCAELVILSLFVMRKNPEKGSEKTLRLFGNPVEQVNTDYSHVSEMSPTTQWSTHLNGTCLSVL